MPIANDIEVPEKKVFKARIHAGKLRSGFQDLPEGYTPLEDRLPQ